MPIWVNCTIILSFSEIKEYYFLVGLINHTVNVYTNVWGLNARRLMLVILQLFCLFLYSTIYCFALMFFRSERVSKTGVNGVLLSEAKYINLSLHYLEQVRLMIDFKIAKSSMLSTVTYMSSHYFHLIHTHLFIKFPNKCVSIFL